MIGTTEIIGFGIGAISGAVQFFLLSKFTGSATGGKSGMRTVLFALTQFLFPFAVLLISAFLLEGDILPIGIGMAASLVVCAVIKYVIYSRAAKK
ncbi:MAG: hypothetical protein FWD44_03810 [Oscillospiraceae bacterium]|nr:hypothetical protein [Oscillospiraceae bacterium]